MSGLVTYFSKYIFFIVLFISFNRMLNASDLPTTSDSFICPICLDGKDENLTTTHCGHIFHKPCLKRWMRIKPTCPVCRSPCELSIDVRFNRTTRRLFWKKEEATEGQLLLYEPKALIFISEHPRYQITIACQYIKKTQQQNRFLSLYIQGKKSPFHIEFSSPQKSAQMKQVLSEHCT